jgi:transaldolase
MLTRTSGCSFISPKEALAQGEFGVDSATVSAEVLSQLATIPYDRSARPSGIVDVPKPQYPEHQNSVFSTPKRLQHLAAADPLAAADWDGSIASTDVDYLKHNGAELEKAIKADPIASARISDALGVFLKVEGESRELIEGVMKEVA